MDPIKELEELVVFIDVLGNAVDASTKDGLGVEDIGAYLPAFMAAPEAFTGLGALKELKMADLSAEVVGGIKEKLAENLDLADDQLELVIEDAFGVIADIMALSERIKALKEAA